MGAMSVAVLISVVQRDGLSPRGTALEVNVLNVGAGIDDVYINALAAV
jgi:hypothetical protein